MKNMIDVVTRRGSHVHHTPHVGFAQIEPATMQSPVKRTPISAEATASASNHGRRVHSQPTLARKTTTNARYASQAAGTCTNMTRYTSPWTASVGAQKSAIHVTRIDAAVAAMPSHGRSRIAGNGEAVLSITF